MRMPVLFVGHGNPMNAIEHNEFRAAWSALGQRLPKPRSILCVSAHWETRNAYVTATDKPETIHDFHGFPKALFDMRYPAPGDPALANRITALVKSERVRLDPGRGLDHGAWSVLIAMYPGADIPVVQLSIDTSLPGRHHFELARQLAPLRNEAVLILASGNLVHNLPLFRFNDIKPQAWAVRCDELLRELVAGRRHDELVDYPGLDAEARLAVPTPEHYLPLLYAVALQEPGESADFFNTRVVGSISMTSLVIGGPSPA